MSIQKPTNYIRFRFRPKTANKQKVFSFLVASYSRITISFIQFFFYYFLSQITLLLAPEFSAPNSSLMQEPAAPTLLDYFVLSCRKNWKSATEPSY